MFKLNNAFLQELGLDALPAQDKNMMLKHIYDTLEIRVGMKLAERMSREQLDEFEHLMPKPEDSNDIKIQKQDSSLRWLETNFPDYKMVVAGELERLKQEIRQAAPQILEASQQD